MFVIIGKRGDYMTKVFIVEDDANIREIIKYALITKPEYELYEFESSKQFWNDIKTNEPNLIILDIMLPNETGLEILKKLKSRDVTKDIPVIMLSAKSSEFDKVTCFDLGADDYITKPFSILELLARVRAVTKRYASKGAEVITYSNLVLDLSKHSVVVDNSPINLTLKEYEILKYLLENKNTVITRDQLIYKIWGYDFEGESRTVDVHINTLRKKLGFNKDEIKTIRGVGYIING